MLLFFGPALFMASIVCASASEIVIKRYVEQQNNVCIVAQLAATIYVDYTDVSGKPQTSTLEVGDQAVVQNTGDECANQVLALNFEKDRYFAMQFALNETTQQTCVTSIALSTVIDSVTFPGHVAIGATETIFFNETSFCTELNTSYACNPGVGLKTDAYLLRLSHLRLESFRTSDDQDFMYGEAVCPEDRRSSSITVDPVVVAAVIVTVITCTLLLNFLRKNRNALRNVV